MKLKKIKKIEKNLKKVLQSVFFHAIIKSLNRTVERKNTLSTKQKISMEFTKNDEVVIWS